MRDEELFEKLNLHGAGAANKVEMDGFATIASGVGLVANMCASVEALWDTGSQVCVVSRKWQRTYLPLEVLRNVEELLGAGEELNLEAMNGTDIPFDGWIEVRFKLAGDDTTTGELTVPVLVGQKEQEYPIIGFNVIEEVLSQHRENSQVVSNIIQQSFSSVHHTHVGARVISSSQDHRILVPQLSKLEREMLFWQKERQRTLSVKFTLGLFLRECQ